MKRLSIGSLSLMLVFAACSSTSEVDEKYGEKITLTESTEISAILENPGEFVGKRVLVSGEILEVCPMMGCWIDLAGDEPGQKIRAKVEDGVIVFPKSAKGSMAMVEGNVEEIKLSKEEAVEWRKHHAKELGEEFDPSTVTGPETIYRIWGLGAVIEKGA